MQGKKITNWNDGKISRNAHAGWANINMVRNEIDAGFRQKKLVSAEVAENLSLGNFVGLLLSMLKSKLQNQNFFQI